MSDIDILNESLAGEHFGVAAYDAAVGTGLLDEPTAGIARAFQGQHRDHGLRLSELITARGGKPVAPLSADKYAVEYPPLKDAGDIVAYAIVLESGAAQASVASVGRYADRDLAVVAAQIAGVEAMHWAALLAATGQNPAPVSFIPLPD